MDVFSSSLDASSVLVGRPAVAIGNFDGVHIGHQALFRRTLDLARQEGQPAIVLTFAPHPARFFRPELAPPLITTEDQKLRLLADCGLDAVVIEPFDRNLAEMPPEVFVQRVLVGQLRSSHVVVGSGFVFGRQRAGHLSLLQQLGEELGFVAHGLQPVRAEAIVVSSTKIRELILLGRVDGAAALLGRPYAVEGRVVPGAGRGRTIGIPTANLAPINELLPRQGVYAGYTRVVQDEGVAPQRCVINVGQAPTFARGGAPVVEAHLLDFAGDLVHRLLEVSFVHRLRDEQRFSGIDALVRAIQLDIARAQELLSSPRLAG